MRSRSRRTGRLQRRGGRRDLSDLPSGGTRAAERDARDVGGPANDVGRPGRLATRVAAGGPLGAAVGSRAVCDLPSRATTADAAVCARVRAVPRRGGPQWPFTRQETRDTRRETRGIPYSRVSRLASRVYHSFCWP